MNKMCSVPPCLWRPSRAAGASGCLQRLRELEPSRRARVRDAAHSSDTEQATGHAMAEVGRLLLMLVIVLVVEMVELVKW